CGLTLRNRHLLPLNWSSKVVASFFSSTVYAVHKTTKENSVNSVNETRQEVQVVRRFDFVVRDEGTIWLFTPLTRAALQFLSEHIQEDAQYFGDSLAVDHRCVEGLLHG